MSEEKNKKKIPVFYVVIMALGLALVVYAALSNNKNEESVYNNPLLVQKQEDINKKREDGTILAVDESESTVTVNPALKNKEEDLFKEQETKNEIKKEATNEKQPQKRSSVTSSPTTITTDTKKDEPIKKTSTYNEDDWGDTSATVKKYDSGMNTTGSDKNLTANAFIKVYLKERIEVVGNTEIVAYSTEEIAGFEKGAMFYGTARFDQATKRVVVSFYKVVSKTKNANIKGRGVELNKTGDLLCEINKHTGKNLVKGVVNTTTKVVETVTPEPVRDATGNVTTGLQQEKSEMTATLPKLKQFYVRFF